MLPSQKGTITFELPVPPSRGWEDYSRAGTMLNGDWYYHVICENTATGKVIHNEKYSQPETVTIADIEPGSCKVSAAFYEKDEVISLCRGSFTETSSGSATCTVTAGETTPVTIEMSLQEMYGWHLEGERVRPYYAVNDCAMVYSFTGEHGSYVFAIINPAAKENRRCTVTVTVDETSVQASHDFNYLDGVNAASIDFDEYGTELTSQKIAEAVAEEKTFTVKVRVSSDEQYTITVPPRFAEMCKEIDDGDSGSECYQFSNSVFIAMTENYNAIIILFKDNPRLCVFQLDGHAEIQTYRADETTDGTQSALDWIDLGRIRIPGEFLLYSQFAGNDYQQNTYTQGLGDWCESFDEMKTSLPEIFTSGENEITFHSSVNPAYNTTGTLSAETTAALADWLGVTFPAPRPEGIFVGDINNPPSESGYRAAMVNDMDRMIIENNYSAVHCFSLNNDEQITAAQQFIAEGVDYLLLSPANVTGWDTVLQNARHAGVKVIFYDRKADVDESLYETFICQDMHLEGEKAVNWLAEQNLPVYNIVHLQGAIGADAQIGRTNALNEMVSQNENWNLVSQETAVWSADNAKAIVEDVIRSGKSFKVIYAENDDMAKGAVEALDEAGITHGVNGDVVIVSFDCCKWALMSVLEKNWNCDVQCNPFQTEYVNDVIVALENGESVPKTIIIEDRIFDAGTITMEDVDTYGLGVM